MKGEENEKGVKAVARCLRRNFYFVMVLVSVGFVLSIFIYYWCDLTSLATAGITSWDDLRSLGLFVGGTVAPIVAFLGLHLSTGKLHEEKKQTTLQTASSVQQRYVDAVGLLSGQENHQKFSGITALRDPDIARNDTLMNAASSTLTSFIRTYGRPMARNQGTDTDTDRIEMVQEAFNTWFFLEREHVKALGEGKQRQTRLIFKNLNLPSIRFARDLPIRLIKFEHCDFSNMECFGPKLDCVSFDHCTLTSAEFFSSELVGCEFTRNTIDSAGFQNIRSEDKSRLLLHSIKLIKANFYFAETPPKLEVGMRLNTPVKEDGELMTAGEARQALGEDEYDIQGPDNEVPKFIIYRGPDDRAANIDD